MVKRESRRGDISLNKHRWPDHIKEAWERSRDERARHTLWYNPQIVDAYEMIPQGEGEAYNHATGRVWEALMRKSIELGRIDPKNVPKMPDENKSKYWNLISDFNKYFSVMAAVLISRDILGQDNIATFESFCELSWYQFITTPQSLWDEPAALRHRYWTHHLDVFLDDKMFSAFLAEQYRLGRL